MRTTQQASREAERRFPVRIRIGVAPGGLGSRLNQMNAWWDANCGADGWAMTPSGTSGVYFADPTIASAFVVARWCAAQRFETIGGVFRVEDNEPTPWTGTALHKTP